MSTNVYEKFRCAPLHMKKALGIFRELIPTTTTTTRVAFWDPTSGSKIYKKRLILQTSHYDQRTEINVKQTNTCDNDENRGMIRKTDYISCDETADKFKDIQNDKDNDTHTLAFWLTDPFFWSYFRLGWYPKVNF